MAIAENKLHIEEVLNSLTHGFGALLSVIGTIALVLYTYLHGQALHVTCSVIYGLTLIMLYSASTVYHAAIEPSKKARYKILDHACIYLLIAGSYTPFMLITLKGKTGLTLLGIVWSMAIIGVVYKMFFYNQKFKLLSTILYMIMGWMAIFVIKPLIASLPFYGLMWVMIGAFCYSIGAIFYLKDKKKYFHAIWHLFVLGGSISHFIAVAFYVMQFKQIM